MEELEDKIVDHIEPIVFYESDRREIAKFCLEIAKTTAIEFAKYRISAEGKQQYHQCLKLIKELKMGPYEQLFDLFLKSKNKTKN
jgi:hypothetical protein